MLCHNEVNDEINGSLIMNMNKILTASLLASVISVAVAEDCTKTGFYVGLEAGAQYNNNKAKAQYNEGEMDFGEDGVSGDQAGGGDGLYDPATIKQAEGKIKKNKVKPTFALTMGYAYDIDGSCTIIAGEVYVSIAPGKTKKEAQMRAAPEGSSNFVENDLTKFTTIMKEKLEVGAFLKAGYKVTPDCTFYVKLGLAGTKYDIRVQGNKATHGAVTDEDPNYTLSKDGYDEKKSKMKFGFVYGVEAEYKFTPDLALTVSVTAKTRTSLKMPEKSDEIMTYHVNNVKSGVTSYKTLPIKFTIGLRYFF